MLDLALNTTLNDATKARLGAFAAELRETAATLTGTNVRTEE